MVKCEYATEGDSCFGKEFKNKAMLNTHVKHKHKDIGCSTSTGTEPEIPLEDRDDPTLDDFGINEDKESIGACSECGTEIFERVKQCPNCKVGFD